MATGTWGSWQDIKNNQSKYLYKGNAITDRSGQSYLNYVANPGQWSLASDAPPADTSTTPTPTAPSYTNVRRKVGTYSNGSPRYEFSTDGGQTWAAEAPNNAWTDFYDQELGFYAPPREAQNLRRQVGVYDNGAPRYEFSLDGGQSWQPDAPNNAWTDFYDVDTGQMAQPREEEEAFWATGPDTGGGGTGSDTGTQTIPFGQLPPDATISYGSGEDGQGFITANGAVVTDASGQPIPWGTEIPGFGFSQFTGYSAIQPDPPPTGILGDSDAMGFDVEGFWDDWNANIQPILDTLLGVQTEGGDQLGGILEQLHSAVAAGPETQDVDYSGFDTTLSSLDRVLRRIGTGNYATDEQGLEEAAKGAGFFNADGSGNVQAYRQSLQRGRNATVGGQQGLTANERSLRERQIRGQERSMRESANQMVEAMMGESGSWGQAMQASMEFASMISDQRIAAEVQMENDNFARQLANFEAQNQRYGQAVASGELSRQAFLTRRQADMTTVLDGMMGKLGAQLQKVDRIMAENNEDISVWWQTIQGLSLTAEANERAAYLALGINEQLLDDLADKYSQTMAPIWDQIALLEWEQEQDQLEEENAQGWLAMLGDFITNLVDAVID